MTHDLDSSANQYTPGNEYYAPSYNVVNNETSNTAENFNEILKSIYDKIQYVKNNLDGSYLNLFNLSYKLGLDVFTKLIGTADYNTINTIQGNSTTFLSSLIPGNYIKIEIDDTNFLYFTVKSIEDNFNVTIYEDMDPASSFLHKNIYVFSVQRTYDVIQSELTSGLDTSIKGVIEYIGTVLNNVDTKLTNVINGLGFDEDTGQITVEAENLIAYIDTLVNEIAAANNAITNITTSVGLLADGTKTDYGSTNYITADGPIKEAIEELDAALAAQVALMATSADLSNLIATVGAASTGTHPGYPTTKKFITGTTTSTIQTLIELDSKMNAWPGHVDVVLDTAWVGLTKPTNIVETFTELAAYINSNGPGLNVVVKPGIYLNSATVDAPVFQGSRISGCKFYSDGATLKNSIRLSGPDPAGVQFNPIQFHGFTWGPANIASQDGYTANISLANMGMPITPPNENEQMILFSQCYFEKYSNGGAVMTNYDFISFDTVGGAAVIDVKITFSNCESKLDDGIFITSPTHKGYLVNHKQSATSGNVAIAIIGSELHQKIKVTAIVPGSNETLLSNLTVVDSYMTDPLELLVTDTSVGIIEIKGSYLNHRVDGAGNETNDAFLNLEGVTGSESNYVNISDTLITHNNAINILSAELKMADNIFLSKRLNIILHPVPFIKIVANDISINNIRNDYEISDSAGPGTEYVSQIVKIEAATPALPSTLKKLFINEIEFENLTPGAPLRPVTEGALVIDPSDSGTVGDGFHGSIKNVKFMHDAQNVLFREDLSGASVGGNSLTVQNVDYYSTSSATEPFIAPAYPTFSEFKNRNSLYIGQSLNAAVPGPSAWVAFGPGSAYDFVTNQLIDLGQFILGAPSPDLLLIKQTGFYEVGALLTIPGPAVISLFVLPSVFVYEAGTFPMMPAMAPGESFNVVLALSKGDTIQVRNSIFPAAEGLRFWLKKLDT